MKIKNQNIYCIDCGIRTIRRPTRLGPDGELHSICKPCEVARKAQSKALEAACRYETYGDPNEYQH